MKKILTITLVLLLMLAVCAFPASAAGTGSFQVVGAEGKQGETVTVAVNLKTNPGLITMKFAVSYPADLELIKVENSALLNGWTTPSPTISSPYTIRWADSLATSNNTATGKIVTLTFKIKTSATPGSKTVTVNFNESRDANGGKNTFANATATVKVHCKTHFFSSYASAGTTQHSRSCTVCGYVEKTNHTWNSGSVTKPATCKEAGVKTYTCMVCNATKTETIAKLTNHTFGQWTKVNDITHQRTCAVCNRLEAGNHAWNAGTVTKPATCKEAGVKTYTCTVCKATKTETIAKLTNHTFGQWARANDTTHYHSCTVCQEIERAEHTWNAGAVTKPATCKEAGVKTYTCTGCNATRTEAIAKLTNHTYDNSCDASCNVCGQTRNVSHSYKTSWSKDKNSHWHECSVCKNKNDFASHTPGPAATENTAQTCTTCGYVIKSALGHTHTFSTEISCDQENHWYACLGCDEKKSFESHEWEGPCDTVCDVCNTTREALHSSSQGWKTDKTNHWQECDMCGVKFQQEAHIPGSADTAITAQTCTICGAELAPAQGTPETQPTEPDTEPSEPNEPTEPTQASKGLVKNEEDAEEFPLWILITAVLVIAGVVCLVFGLKKRR